MEAERGANGCLRHEHSFFSYRLARQPLQNVSGDNDLLTLETFQNIQIVSARQFLDILAKPGG